MADDVKDLVVRLSLENNQLKKELKKTRDQFEKTKKEQDKTKKSLSGLRAGYVLLAGVVTGVVGAAFKKITGLAKDFEEANSKFGVVFRGNSREANAMRKELVNAYGLSTLAATNMLASIQDFLVPMGLARDEATSLSGKVSILARDIGSFNDQPTERVLDAIKSALSGISMPMKQFGVDVSEAGLQQQLMNEGVSKSVRELTRAEKAQLIYRKIVADSSDAQGDFVRTSDSVANTLVSVQAVAEDVQLALGQQMLDAIAPTVREFGKFIKTEEGITAISTGVKLLALIAQVAWQSSLKPVFLGFRLLLDPIVQSIKAIIESFTVLQNDSLSVGQKLKQLGKIGINALKGVGETAKETGETITSDYKSMGENLIAIFKATEKAQIEGINNVVDADADANNKIVAKKQLTAEQTKEIDRLTKKEQFMDEQEKLQAKIDALEKFKKEYKLSAKQIAAIKTALDEFEEQSEAAKWKKRFLIAQKTLSAISTVEQSLSNFVSSLQAKELADIEKKVEEGVLTEKEGANAKAEIEHKIANDKKTLGIISAVISTAQGVARALNDYPFPASAIIGGLVGGLGAAQIITIANTPVPAKQTFQQGGRPNISEPSLVGEAGPEIFVPDQSGTIIPNNEINNNTSVGGVTINVQSDNGQEVVEVLNDYFRQFGTSAQGVAI